MLFFFRTFIVLWLLLPFLSEAQGDFDFASSRDKRKAEKLVRKFLKVIEAEGDVSDFLTSEELNIAGDVWVRPSNFSRLQRSLFNSEILEAKINCYDMGDASADPELSGVVELLNPVFTNHSVLARLAVPGKSWYLVLNEESEAIKISGVLSPRSAVFFVGNSCDWPYTKLTEDHRVAVQFELESQSYVSSKVDLKPVNQDTDRIFYEKQQLKSGLLSSAQKWMSHQVNRHEVLKLNYRLISDGVVYDVEMLDGSIRIISFLKADDEMVVLKYLGEEQDLNLPDACSALNRFLSTQVDSSTR